MDWFNLDSGYNTDQLLYGSWITPKMYTSTVNKCTKDSECPPGVLGFGQEWCYWFNPTGQTQDAGGNWQKTCAGDAGQKGNAKGSGRCGGATIHNICDEKIADCKPDDTNNHCWKGFSN